jgi:hypothetical protein
MRISLRAHAYLELKLSSLLYVSVCICVCIKLVTFHFPENLRLLSCDSRNLVKDNILTLPSVY